MATVSTNPGPVVLFDGDCSLCNGAVQWLLRRDRHGRLRFAALQSAAGRTVIADTGDRRDLPDSIVLVVDRRVHVRSGAALRLLRYIRWPWPLAMVFLLVPWPLRDLVYDWIARNRIRWFGRQTTCMVPTKDLRARFLDADERGGA